MLLARAVIFLLLGAGIVCLALYLWTGEIRYRLLGVRIVMWTVAAGLLFFAVLIVEQLAGR